MVAVGVCVAALEGPKFWPLVAPDWPLGAAPVELVCSWSAPEVEFELGAKEVALSLS